MYDKHYLSACRVVVGAVIMASLLTGCANENKKKIKEHKVSVETTFSQITSEYNAEKKLELQMKFFDELQALKAIWPESKEKTEFLNKYGSQASSIPNTVYSLSVAQKNLDAFKWSTELLGKKDHNYFSLQDVSPEWAVYLVESNPDCLKNDQFCKSVTSRAVEEKNYDAARFLLKQNSKWASDKSFESQLIKTTIQNKDIDGLKLIVSQWPENISFQPYNNCITFAFDNITDEDFLAKFVRLSTGKMSSATGVGCKPNIKKLLKKSEIFRNAIAQNPQWIVAVYDLGSGTYDDEQQEILFDSPKEVYENIAESKDQAWYYNWIIPIFLGESPASEKDFFKMIGVAEEKGWITKGIWSFIFDNAVKNHVAYALDYVFSNSDGKYTVFDIDLVEIANDQSMWDKYFPVIKEGKVYLSGRHDDGVTLPEVDKLLCSTNYAAAFDATQYYANWLTDLGQYTEAVGRTMLMSVCAGGNLDAAKFLIEDKKVDVNEKTDHQEGDVDWRRAAKEGSLTAIFYAASSGSCELLQYLVDNSANVKDQSYFKATPLMFAAENGHIEAVKLLLSLGADPNAKMAPPDEAFIGKSAAYAAEMGKTASAYNRAKKNGHKEVMQIIENALEN